MSMGILWQVLAGFGLGILASIKIVPWIYKRQQRELKKTLLRQWCGGCMGAMGRLEPPTSERINIEGYEGSNDYVLTQLLKDIKEGRKNPEGIAAVISQALTKVLYTEKELKSKDLPDHKMFFFAGNPEVPMSMINRILGPMYARIDMFELDLLPTGELELAKSQLESASQKGFYTSSMYDSYALHLAKSMEAFAKYLWKLEGRKGDA